MAVMDSIKEAQNRSIEQMKTLQEQVISVNERMADSVMGSMPDFSSPFAQYLPRPAEMVETYFGFMGQLHEANKDFAARIVQVWERPENAAAATSSKK